MEKPRRILLVQLYSNGDCLYATAVARQIKQDFPGSHLSWMIAGFCQSILSGNPYVDEIVVTNEVTRNDVVAFRQLKKKLQKEKTEGKWDELFITHNMDDNQALYDGTVRGMIFRAYPNPIIVPVQPVLVLTEKEKQQVKTFTENHSLRQFKNVILWEFAPQSGQSVLSFDFVFRVAGRITQIPGTAVILSSATSFTGTDTIFDASSLSVRENAELTHYCTLLIGCSSGITWLSTSSAGKQLPMLQLVDPKAFFRNAPSVDFDRYGIAADNLVELFQFDEEKIVAAIESMLEEGAGVAKAKFNQPVPVQFNTTRKIVYNLLCYLQFSAIARHYRITKSVYGRHPLFIKQFILGFLTFPFKLLANKWKKRKA